MYLKYIIFLFIFSIGIGAEQIIPAPQSNYEIKELITKLSRTMQKRFVLDNDIQGSVTILGALPDSPKELFSTIESALVDRNIGIINNGKYYVVTSLQKTREQLTSNSQSSNVEVIPLSFLSVQEALAALKPLLSTQTFMGGVANRNQLIIASSSHHVTRIRSLLAKLDVPGQETKIIQIKHRSASAIVETLKQSSHIKNQNIAIDEVSGQNAIVVTAPPATLQLLIKVVQSIDTLPKQVLIEAIIAEIQEDRARQIGGQWTRLLKQGSVAINNNSFTANGNKTTPVLSVQYGSLGEDLLAILNFLESDHTSHILSTPSVITEDNQEAQLIVGQNVPIITGQYSQTTNANTLNPFQTIARQDIGISLKVKPQILEDFSVRLILEQEVSHLANSTVASDIITNKRLFKTRIVAKSGELIILGGLHEHDTNSSENKIPVLGDIPIIGSLFKGITQDESKRTLMVFVKPTIIEHPDSVPSALEILEQENPNRTDEP